MKKRTKILLCIFIPLAVLLLTAGGVFLYLSVPSVTFDFSRQSELTGRASGFLYGFAEDDIPSAEIAESIGISSLATKTAGGLQHPIGDVGDVADTFLSAGGGMLMVYTQDMYDTWYYQLDSLEEYNEKVKTTVTETENSSYRDSLVYCIYNEMDNGAWLGDFREEENRYKFYAAWKDTYAVVKDINPDAKIAGPGYCGYNYDFIKEFLSYCKENDCLPEVVVWHELSDQSIYWLEHNFEGYYSICDELGIDRLPVCISEYGLMKTNGIPGESVKWISRLEKEDAYGCVAYWRLANNLSDTVADDVMPNSNYWVYNFYAKMKGKELAAEEWDLFHSNIGNYLKGKYPLMNKGFIALSSYDEAEEKFYIMAGGSETDSKIKIENLDGSAYRNGDKITVKISYVDYKGLGGEVTSPVFCETLNLTVRGNSIKLTIPCERESQAFFVEITKGESVSAKNDIKTLRYEAEEASLPDGLEGTDLVAYAVSEGKAVKGITSDTSVVFKVNAPDDGKYKLDIVYGNANTDTSGRKSINATVTVGEKAYSVRLPSSVKEDCMECVSLYVQLEKGKNEIEVTPESGASLVLDFIDITLSYGLSDAYCERLTSRNTPADENAYSVVVPEDGCYKLTDLTDDSSVIINGYEIKGDGDGIFYLRRGYSKIILPEGETMLYPSFIDNDEEMLIFTPDGIALIGTAAVSEDSNTASGKHIGWISSEAESGIEFTVNAKKDGYYALTVEYANNEEGGYHDYNVDLIERYISVSVNGEKQGNFFFRSTYSWDYYKTKTIILELSEGENLISLTNDGSYSFNNRVTYAPDIGCIYISEIA